MEVCQPRIVSTERYTPLDPVPGLGPGQRKIVREILRCVSQKHLTSYLVELHCWS
jgi:hypothetical protein